MHIYASYKYINEHRLTLKKYAVFSLEIKLQKSTEDRELFHVKNSPKWAINFGRSLRRLKTRID